MVNVTKAVQSLDGTLDFLFAKAVFQINSDQLWQEYVDGN